MADADARLVALEADADAALRRAVLLETEAGDMRHVIEGYRAWATAAALAEADATLAAKTQTDRALEEAAAVVGHADNWRALRLAIDEHRAAASPSATARAEAALSARLRQLNAEADAALRAAPAEHAALTTLLASEHALHATPAVLTVVQAAAALLAAVRALRMDVLSVGGDGSSDAPPAPISFAKVRTDARGSHALSLLSFSPLLPLCCTA